MKKALLIVDHGSKRTAANEMLADVADLVKTQKPELIVHIAHMELAEPTIAEGLAACVADGAQSIVVHPYMLSPGRHATEDIPRLVAQSAAQYPDVEISVSAPLGVHPKLADVILERADI